MKRFRINDNVIVKVGKSKGHIAKIVLILGDKAIVEGANKMKKHVKPNPQNPEQKSGIVSTEGFIHISNIAHYNPNTKKADKVGFKFIDNDGAPKKVRYFKSDNEIIDRA